MRKWAFISCCIVIALATSAVSSVPTSVWAQEYIPSRASLNVAAKLVEPRLSGELLVDAIRAIDMNAVLRFIPENDLVAVDFDRNMSGLEIKRQLELRRGYIYAVLFDSGQLQQLTGRKNAISLHEYFVRTK